MLGLWERMSSDVGTVLLAIDEPVMLDLMRKVLERAGYEVICAGSSKEALGVLSARHVGIIVAHMSAPTAGVEQLVERAREISQAPIVVISAHGENELPGDARDAIQGFLRMPFAAAELVSAVRKAAA